MKNLKFEANSTIFRLLHSSEVFFFLIGSAFFGEVADFVDGGDVPLEHAQRLLDPRVGHLLAEDLRRAPLERLVARLEFGDARLQFVLQVLDVLQQHHPTLARLDGRLRFRRLGRAQQHGRLRIKHWI